MQNEKLSITHSIIAIRDILKEVDKTIDELFNKHQKVLDICKDYDAEKRYIIKLRHEFKDWEDETKSNLENLEELNKICCDELQSIAKIKNDESIILMKRYYRDYLDQIYNDEYGDKKLSKKIKKYIQVIENDYQEKYGKNEYVSLLYIRKILVIMKDYNSILKQLSSSIEKVL